MGGGVDEMAGDAGARRGGSGPRGSDEGERGRGKNICAGGVELTRPRGGGRLPYPLATADEVVRRGVAPVATAPGEQGE